MRKSISLRSSRSGFSLLEIVISMAVLLGALTAIFQLISMGTQASVQGKFRSDAVLHAETKLQEALAGVIPMQSSGAAPLDEDPNWMWALSVEPGTLDGLLQISLTMTREGSGPNASHSYTMTRLVRDPQLFLDAALEE